MASKDSGQKKSKVGRNAAFCKAYALAGRREINKAARMLREYRRSDKISLKQWDALTPAEQIDLRKSGDELPVTRHMSRLRSAIKQLPANIVRSGMQAIGSPYDWRDFA